MVGREDEDWERPAVIREARTRAVLSFMIELSMCLLMVEAIGRTILVGWIERLWLLSCSPREAIFNGRFFTRQIYLN